MVKMANINGCTPFVLMALVILSPLTDALHYSVFYLNQARIAQTQCVQRYNPLNQCKGKCRLKKLLESSRERGERCLLLEKFEFSVYHFEPSDDLGVGFAFNVKKPPLYSYNRNYKPPIITLGSPPPEG